MAVKSFKSIIKPVLRPLVGPGLRILHLRLFGRHIFINKYTRRIPIFDKTVDRIQGRMLFIETRREREADYRKWFRKHNPKRNQLSKAQRSEQARYKRRPLISIILPTYNTKPEHLRACIKSVLDQTYDNWELCVADDASSNQAVRDIIAEFAEKEKRIKYILRKENGHICRASNSALDLATGKYIALLDHDDLLWSNALFEVVKKKSMNIPRANLYTVMKTKSMKRDTNIQNRSLNRTGARNS